MTQNGNQLSGQTPSCVKIELVQDRNTGHWRACVWGRGAAILRPVPGNVTPAHVALWPSEAAARAELPTLCGCAVEIVKVTT